MAMSNLQNGNPRDGAERLAAWKHLIDTSTKQERDEVMRLISERNNIFRILPVELVIEILDRLPLFESFRLQRVCRSWKALFSEHTIVRSSLTAWETHNSSDSVRDAQYLATQTNASKLRHVQAMRCGRPFSQASFEEFDAFKDEPGSVQEDDFPQLKGTRLAFIRRPRQGCNSIRIRDLVSGKTTDVYGDARENIIGMSLSSTLVAFTSYSGKLYTEELRSGFQSRKSVRLPSAAVMAMHADRDTVSVMMKGPGPQYRYSVAIFDFGSGSLKLIDNLHPKFASPQGFIVSSGKICVSSFLLVNANDKIIDTFDYAFDSENQDNLRVEHARYSFEGERICGGVSTWLNDAITVDPSVPRCHPTGFKDMYTLTFATSNIRAYEMLPFDGTPVWPALTEGKRLDQRLMTRGYIARFDYKTATLAVHQGWENDEDACVCENGSALQGSHQVWKDMHFHRVLKPNNAFLISINPEHVSTRGAGYGHLLKWPRLNYHLPQPRTNYQVSLHVNETFAVACYQVRPQDRGFIKSAMHIFVASFDEALQLAGSQSTLWWDSAEDGHLVPDQDGSSGRTLWRHRGHAPQRVEGTYLDTRKC